MSQEVTHGGFHRLAAQIQSQNAKANAQLPVIQVSTTETEEGKSVIVNDPPKVPAAPEVPAPVEHSTE